MRDYINYLLFKKNIKNISYKYKDIYLDNNQKEAVLSNFKDTLVIASAGSGKTFVIESKIDYLIKNKVKEKEILVLSFTNSSVEDLKKKIKYDVDIYTFHKLSSEILSDYNYYYRITSDYLSYIINEIFLSICSRIKENDLNYFNSEITNFINLFKSYNYDNNYLDKISKKNNKLLKLINKIYYIYQDELYSQGLIDLNDLINEATRLIKERGFKRYYKYIIIDEYQDISLSRFNLIRVIKESCLSNIFAVGDDYQSIYKFSGSNINLILDFKKYFKKSKLIILNKTYRNSYELIKASNKFISKNKKQVYKKINSDKHINKPIKIIYYLKNMDIKLKKVLDLTSNCVILERNNNDIKYINDKDITIKDTYIKYLEKEYKYMTIHKSKGLEFENVIIIKMDDNFPPKNNNKLQKIILPKEKYLNEEERRLFYVALTRTKNNVYILVDKERPSKFVNELININKKYIEVLDL